jgi:predicted dehydrogenase
VRHREDVYLERLFYICEMKKLLMCETGIYFIDTFRYLAGEVSSVYAQFSRLNPVIAGEDAGIILFQYLHACTWHMNLLANSNLSGIWNRMVYHFPKRQCTAQGDKRSHTRTPK